MGYIRIKPSKTFIDVLEELSSVQGAPQNVKSYKNSKDEPLLLETNDIKWCHAKIKERGIEHRIHVLLNESEIILPHYEPPPRNPELEARVQRLKAQQAVREYQEMTKNLLTSHYDQLSLGNVGQELREMNRQLVTGAQYLLSLIGTFCGVFFGLSLALDGYGTRVLLATFSALAVGIAEIYFIIRDDIWEEKKISEKNK